MSIQKDIDRAGLEPRYLTVPYPLASRICSFSPVAASVISSPWALSALTAPRHILDRLRLSFLCQLAQLINGRIGTKVPVS